MTSTTPSASEVDTWVALLGRGQDKADGIQDYCHFLGEALGRHGVSLQISRVDWPHLGWRRALAGLRRDCQSWRGRWVLFQYTALAFSSRGFPLRALAVLRILRKNGARCAVVFHDPFRQGGRAALSHLRGEIQEWVIRRMLSFADRAIFPDPLSKVVWLPKNSAKAITIPIGANIPEPLLSAQADCSEYEAPKAVAVFCLSLDTLVLAEELKDLSVAAQTACDSGARFRLIFLGHGTEEAREAIAMAFRSMPVDISVLGLLSPQKVTEALSGAHAMLCVRGKLYPRRGSAIAGIACGLPIVGYAGEAEGTPLAEAGILFVPYRDGVAMGKALARVLSNPALALELEEKSRRVQREYYSWDLIAAKFIEALGAQQS